MRKRYLFDHSGVVPREQKGIKVALKLCSSPSLRSPAFKRKESRIQFVSFLAQNVLTTSGTKKRVEQEKSFYLLHLLPASIK